MSQIDIKISKRTGEISIEGVGYEGNGCVHDIDELQNLIGLKTLSDEKTDNVHTVECLRTRT